jgi:hypothetical protein
MLHFTVPAGIGDFLAMYMKLSCLKREDEIVISATGDSPRRLLPLLMILPRVQAGGYTPWGSGDILRATLPPGTDLETLPDGDYPLAINGHLEGGGTVDSWVPGPIDYHPAFSTPDSLVDPVLTLLEAHPDRPLVGIYTSAYGNARHWGFWGVGEWWRFMERLHQILPPETLYVFIGAEYDAELAPEVMAKCTEHGVPYINTMGQFHIGATAELIRRLDYFFVFPSGLGFIADIVRTPNCMWFPPHLSKMRHTFSDPRQNITNQNLHLLFQSPEQTIETWEALGKVHFCERVKFHLGVTPFKK